MTTPSPLPATQTDATSGTVPADAPNTPAQVAEIATFALLPSATESMFLTSAGVTFDLLKEQPGFIGRRLSKGEDGRWTDHVLWSDLQTAHSAASAVMASPLAAPFLAAIDMSSLSMRHETILIQV